MDNEKYWLWLQHGFGYAEKIKGLIEKYTSAYMFYEAGESEWKKYLGKRVSVLQRLKAKSPDDFLDTVKFCKEHSLKILTPDSDFYPKKLLDIDNFPAALFVRGDYTCLNDELPIAVIGSRTPCVYGEEAAVEIVNTLCENNALIVSGGALGIDSVAHKTALNSGKKTVLVMGCGHGHSYLAENSKLRKSVAAQGALISEYLPFTPVDQGTFPQRNRIISGMSKAVVIIEAAERSGTFSTAKHAKRQGRDIFVLPGDIKSGNFAGSNQLILDGAKAVFSGNDILATYIECEAESSGNGQKTGKAFEKIDEKSAEGKTSRRNGKQKNEAETKNDEENTEKVDFHEKNIPEGISKNAEIVYNIMSDGVSELDEITRKSGLEVRHVLVSLTELEMFGYAFADGPNSYRLK